MIRPVVLFGRSPAERAQQTGISRPTIYRKVGRFDTLGMAGLAETTPSASSRPLAPVIRQAIVALEAEHPAFRPHELASICYARFARRPSPHTVKRVLAEEPSPFQVTRRYPLYAEIADPVERRLAIVHLHADGWTIRSIAAYLQTTRRRVYQTLERWIQDGVQGLDDRPPNPRQPARKSDLAAMNAVRRLQVNPEFGEFRIHAAFLRLGIELSPRTCGRILALNRKLYGLPGPAKTHTCPPTGTSPKPPPGLSYGKRMIAGWPSTTTRSTGPTASAPMDGVC